MKKYIASFFIGIAGFLFATVPAFAHVIVHPATVGVAAVQEFTVSVPTEKDNPTVALTLLIPDGVTMVTPNVKAGWTVTEKKKGTGEEAPVTEIAWTDGSIPPGQRDDFTFQAQVPPQPTTLRWKAYQTYQEGSVVAWDHAPTGNSDDDATPPYSTTKVINDLTANTTTTARGNASSVDMHKAEILSLVAVMLAAAALILSWKKK